MFRTLICFYCESFKKGIVILFWITLFWSFVGLKFIWIWLMIRILWVVVVWFRFSVSLVHLVVLIIILLLLLMLLLLRVIEISIHLVILVILMILRNLIIFLIIKFWAHCRHYCSNLLILLRKPFNHLFIHHERTVLALLLNIKFEKFTLKAAERFYVF